MTTDPLSAVLPVLRDARWTGWDAAFSMDLPEIRTTAYTVAARLTHALQQARLDLLPRRVGRGPLPPLDRRPPSCDFQG
jgi:hypothetical protein